MSKLEELILHYCPNGVEYASIGSLITRVRNKGGNNPSIKVVYSVSNTQGLVRAEDFRDNVIYSEDTSNYTIVEQEMFAYNPSRLNIGSLAWLQTDMPGLVSPMYVVFSIDKTRIIPEYLYIHLKSQYVNRKINSLTESGARFRFDFERWGLIEIPVPPIPVQRHIVELLDTFIELQTELQTELQKRKQQFNYYREHLLSFKGRTDIEWKSLGEVCEFKNGFAFKSDLFRREGLPIVRITNITESGVIMDDVKYFHIEDYPKAKLSSFEIKDGDILVAMSGGTTGKIGVFKGAEIAYLNQRAGKFVPGPRIFNRFLYHFLLTQVNEMYKMAGGGAQPNLSSNDLKSKIIVPVPSLKEQESIASTLDIFDTLTNDLTVGLPAEIEKRRQQYEFYRDKLLTFKRKEV